MRRFGEFYESPGRVCLVLLLAAAMFLIAVGGPALAASSTEDAQLMFVQSADDFKLDPATKTLRLVKVNQQTLYFSDRPQRIAGHLKMADYLKTWSQGKDNFGEDPPKCDTFGLRAGS